MKTFIFLFCTTIFGFTSGNIFSQNTKIVIEADKTVTIDEVFDIIKQQTDYTFIYQEDLFKNVAKVHLKKGTIKANELLKISLYGKDFDFIVTNNNTIVVKNKPTIKSNPTILQPQTGIIKGRVIDEKGNPIPGANILVKGTNISTQTDIDGNFTINTSNNATKIVVSYIGMESQEVGIEKSPITIILKVSGEKLEDVVVVGFGTKKKSELTNAVVQIKGDVVVKVPTVTLTNSLQGQLAGLNIRQTASSPGFDNPTINIRGLNTFGTSAALIVIDGVANSDFEGLNKLNPNDIASISVLKDASAAIYGVQAAGGVVLVTTKRGNLGRTKVEVTLSNAYQTPTKLPKMADAISFMRAINSKNELEGTSITYSEAAIAQYTSGEKSSINWLSEVLSTPVLQGTYNITVSGGTQKVKYFIGAGTANQNSALVNDHKFKLDQSNFRSNVDINLFEGLDMGVDLSFRNKQTNTSAYGAGGQLGAVLDFNPTLPAFINGDINLPTNGDGSLSPVAVSMSNGFVNYDAKVYNGKVNFKYEIPKTNGVYVSGFMSKILTNGFSKNFVTPYSFYTQNEITKVVTKNETKLVGGYVNGLYENFTEDVRNTNHAEIGYKRLFNNIHNVSAFVAYEGMSFKSKSLFAGRTAYNSYAIPELFAGIADSKYFQNDGSSSQIASQTFFSRVTYDYQSKYLFSFNFRADGSAIFAQGKRWGYFPGVSGGWVISKEKFMQEARSMFSNLKLRVSWGQLGNDRVPAFQYMPAYGITTGTVINNSDAQGIALTGTPNPDITWEVTTSTDVGLEMGFLKNRLSIELDYFKNLTDHILAKKNFSVPSYTGLTLPDQNIGTMKNTGFEIQAAYHDNIGKFNYQIGGNMSWNQNKVTYFDEVPNIDPKVAAYQNLTGNPLGSPLVLHAIGIYKTDAEAKLGATYAAAKAGYLQYEDKNGDGKIDSNDMYRMPLNPAIQYGFQFSGSYSNFDLALYFTGSHGDYWQFGNNFNQTRGNNLLYAAEHSFTKTNPNAELPKIGENSAGLASDFNTQTRSWLRLKTVNLGFNLPCKEGLSKLYISNFRLYLSADNFLMIYNNMKKYGAADPELLGTVYGGYPFMSTYNFGVNISF